MSVWAIVAAAGRGDRLGADLPKAFVRLGGRVLLAESVERLDRSPRIDAIVVTAPPGWEEPAILLAEELAADKVVSVVTGGGTRGASVAAGLAEVGDDAEAVLVHDAARPLVTDAVVERLLGALGAGWDGAVPGLPVADTVKRVEDGRVVETLERSVLAAVQTPQAFRADVLRAAYAAGGDATDCAALVEAQGGRVTVVEGDPRLVKITTRGDLELVESWL
jgi:2-C-methyl-D-erythritol 4-phosphate cytidylyltransferase